MRYLVCVLLLLTEFAHAAPSAKLEAQVADLMLVSNTQHAIAAYNEFVATDLGMKRTHSIRAQISTSDEDFLTRLQRYRVREAVHLAHNFRGVDFDNRILFLRLDANSTLKDITSLIANTLTYSLQEDLAGGSAKRARGWIREGMKQYIGAALLRKMGGQNFDL